MALTARTGTRRAPRRIRRGFARSRCTIRARARPSTPASSVTLRPCSGRQTSGRSNCTRSFLELKLDRPTALVFDLDPGWPATIVDCSRVALRIRDLLVELALAPLVKTSGAKGLHLYVPLDGSHTYEQTKAFAHAVAKAAARELPELVVDRMALAVRAGKVFIDWAQNDPGKSTVVAYSLRAGGAPTISMPVLWEEVERCQSSGRPGTLVFTADDVRARIKEVGDIFRAAAEPGTRLPMLDS